MELDFWHERWDNNEIGFHQRDVNPYLAYFYDTKGPSLNSRSSLKVFVPLCGKSLDLYWLSTKGYSVIGVECSEVAVKAFYDEQNIKHTVTPTLLHQHYTSRSIDILQGDFFTLSPTDLNTVTDVFDRGALVALPEDMRKQYVLKMSELLNPGTRTLLVAFSYDQSEMNGPPFSVTEEEVHDLYASTHDIDKLLVKDILDNEPRFKLKGLTSLKETIFKLTKR